MGRTKSSVWSHMKRYFEGLEKGDEFTAMELFELSVPKNIRSNYGEHQSQATSFVSKIQASGWAKFVKKVESEGSARKVHLYRKIVKPIIQRDSKDIVAKETTKKTTSQVHQQDIPLEERNFNLLELGEAVLLSVSQRNQKITALQDEVKALKLEAKDKVEEILSYHKQLKQAKEKILELNDKLASGSKGGITLKDMDNFRSTLPSATLKQ